MRLRGWMPIVMALGLLCGLGAPAAAQVTGGRLVVIERFPSRHVAPRRVHVWLPDAYDRQRDARFPVLYMHDGQNVFDARRAGYGQEWGVDEAVARLVARGDMRATIVVGIENSDRRYDEYFPEAVYRHLPPAWQQQVRDTSDAPGEPFSDRYLRFLVEEVKPRIDRDYRTLKGPRDTSIMGSSMGGLISIYALGEYPHVFGQAAALSAHLPLIFPDAPLAQSPDAPGIVIAAFERWLSTTRIDPARNRLYIDRGSVNLDAGYARYLDPFAAMLARRGWGPTLEVRAFTGTDHNETAWRERVDIPLLFLDARD